jgi:hypothetical protein
MGEIQSSALMIASSSEAKKTRKNLTTVKGPFPKK